MFIISSNVILWVIFLLFLYLTIYSAFGKYFLKNSLFDQQKISYPDLTNNEYSQHKDKSILLSVICDYDISDQNYVERMKHLMNSVNKYDFGANKRYEILMLIPKGQNCEPLKNFFSEYSNIISCLYYIKHGISSLIIGSMRSSGKYILNADFIDDLANIRFDRQNYDIYLIENRNLTPNSLYDPSYFYKIGLIKRELFFKVFPDIYYHKYGYQIELLNLLKKYDSKKFIIKSSHASSYGVVLCFFKLMIKKTIEFSGYFVE